MKASMSFTDHCGITVEISVCAQPPALSRLFSGSQDDDTAQDLSDSFLHSLRGMPAQLIQVREVMCQNLLASSCEILKKQDADIKDAEAVAGEVVVGRE